MNWNSIIIKLDNKFLNFRKENIKLEMNKFRVVITLDRNFEDFIKFTNFITNLKFYYYQEIRFDNLTNKVLKYCFTPFLKKVNLYS